MTPMPSAEYGAAWAELRGYVQEAAHDGKPVDPVVLLKFMDELKQRAVAPVRQWARQAASGAMADPTHVQVLSGFCATCGKPVPGGGHTEDCSGLMGP